MRLKNKYMVLLLIIGAVYFLLQYVCPLVTPILIAGLFLTVCYPAFDDIQKKTRIKKQYLASGILLLICAILIILVWLGGSFIISHFPRWIEGMDAMQQEFLDYVDVGCEQIGNLLKIDTSDMADNIIYQTNLFLDNLQTRVSPELLGQTWNFLKQVFSIIGVLAITMIATVLLAKDYDSILSWMGAHDASRLALEVILNIIRYIATFVKAQLVIMICISISCVTLLSAGRVENAPLYGIIAGIMDALPFIGTGIVLIPLGVWQLLQGYYVKALFCIIAYLISILIRNLLEPRLIGKKVGIYPFAILAAIFAGVKLFGLSGILKGPLGLVIIMQTYLVYKRQTDSNQQADDNRHVDDNLQMNYDDKQSTHVEK